MKSWTQVDVRRAACTWNVVLTVGFMKIDIRGSWNGFLCSVWCTTLTSRTLSHLLKVRMRNVPTLWINWTDWSTFTAYIWHWGRCGVSSKSSNKVRPKIWRRRWWSQSCISRSHRIGSNRHISKRRCRWTATQRLHRVIESAQRSKLAYCVLWIFNTNWCTLKNN